MNDYSMISPERGTAWPLGVRNVILRIQRRQDFAAIVLHHFNRQRKSLLLLRRPSKRPSKNCPRVRPLLAVIRSSKSLGEAEGAHLITMEYVHGEDLKSMIRMTGSLNVGAVLSIGKQVCDGLAEAH